MRAKPIEPNWHKLDPWFKQAHDIIQKNGGVCYATGNTTPQFDAWVKYFQKRMPRLPVFMQEAILKQPGYEVTLPTEWPPDHSG